MNAFTQLMSAFMGPLPARRAWRKRLVPLILALTLAGLSRSHAQEAATLAGTNDLMQAEDATDSVQNGDALTDDSATPEPTSSRKLTRLSPQVPMGAPAASDAARQAVL